MINKHKIITMTKLAIYDKHEAEADKYINGFFRHDYLYRKNMSIRLSVGLGGAILLAVYWLRIFFIDGVDILTANLQQQAYESGLFLLAIMAAYSLIGTIQGTREYYLVQKRLDRYLHLLRQLERIETRARREAETHQDLEKDQNDALVYKKNRTDNRERRR